MALKQMKEQSFSIISEDQVIEQDINSKKKEVSVEPQADER